MMKQTITVIQKLVSPKSLRYQLFTRILLILSVILLIIGSLQYLVMKDFLYKNEADTMRAKLMSLPRSLVINSRDQNGRIIYEEIPGAAFFVYG